MSSFLAPAGADWRRPATGLVTAALRRLLVLGVTGLCLSGCGFGPDPEAQRAAEEKELRSRLEAAGCPNKRLLRNYEHFRRTTFRPQRYDREAYNEWAEELVDKLRACWRKGAVVDGVFTKEGKSFLLEATLASDTPVIRFLLEEVGVDPDDGGPRHPSPLEAAVRLRRKANSIPWVSQEVIRVLLDNNADIEGIDLPGNSS
ncbi:MAG: hypothetical protein AAGM22_22730 [Acidobacteriota bacterium]